MRQRDSFGMGRCPPSRLNSKLLSFSGNTQKLPIDSRYVNLGKVLMSLTISFLKNLTFMFHKHIMSINIPNRQESIYVNTFNHSVISLHTASLVYMHVNFAHDMLTAADTKLYKTKEKCVCFCL